MIVRYNDDTDELELREVVNSDDSLPDNAFYLTTRLIRVLDKIKDLELYERYNLNNISFMMRLGTKYMLTDLVES